MDVEVELSSRPSGGGSPASTPVPLVSVSGISDIDADSSMGMSRMLSTVSRGSPQVRPQQDPGEHGPLAVDEWADPALRERLLSASIEALLEHSDAQHAVEAVMAHREVGEDTKSRVLGKHWALSSSSDVETGLALSARVRELAYLVALVDRASTRQSRSPRKGSAKPLDRRFARRRSSVAPSAPSATVVEHVGGEVRAQVWKTLASLQEIPTTERLRETNMVVNAVEGLLTAPLVARKKERARSPDARKRERRERARALMRDPTGAGSSVLSSLRRGSVTGATGSRRGSVHYSSATVDDDTFEDALRIQVSLELTRMRLGLLEPVVFDLMFFLSKLDLSYNSISHLPPTIARIANLREFNISHNTLADLPRELGLCKQLEVLDLSGNVIEELPASLGKLPLLRTLRACGNKLTTLPASFVRLDLQELDLSHCCFAELPAELAVLTSLKSLMLYGNPLVSLQAITLIDSGDRFGVLEYVLARATQRALYLVGAAVSPIHPDPQFVKTGKVSRLLSAQSLLEVPSVSTAASSSDGSSCSDSHSSSSASSTGASNFAALHLASLGHHIPKSPSLTREHSALIVEADALAKEADTHLAALLDKLDTSLTSAAVLNSFDDELSALEAYFPDYVAHVRANGFAELHERCEEVNELRADLHDLYDHICLEREHIITLRDEHTTISHVRADLERELSAAVECEAWLLDRISHARREQDRMLIQIEKLQSRIDGRDYTRMRDTADAQKRAARSDAHGPAVPLMWWQH
ncbi:leucine-rich repeat-containing protein 2 [Thecamonas trahens ATCC 50062]|uniref:Leucine-rich repeat-containing protein 2 n=1 Tax=Thecamonas trahens ATCC 50062 TaxID=461836 RepID=A0A0L0DQR4_THETB|nr:leucine-rich repeat-containing protein 2 [Thecamonas trahens ATCC 50062]KNC53778.1 leucine-rich repeat-containing protein 2 [Thecamonas trahens ATCC 50062]|eukprot:XP_013754340.1 leucine-rich repeat-containing protein 2 [Thecamonas trahens ATCC 50062]